MAKKKSLLVGDGEAWAVDLLGRAAEHHQVMLHHARNGVEAIEMFKNLVPSIVVLDTLLPKVDGLQVAGKLRQMELGRVTPIVITSAIYKRGEDVDRLRQKFGFTDFLEKPFGLTEATQLIGDHLREDHDALAPDTDVVEDGDLIRATSMAETALSPLSVPRLLCDLFDGRKTGVLTLRRGEITKVIFFDQGHVTHARSNSKRDRLGRTLLRSKRITLDEYDRAKRLQLESSGRIPLGAALVRLGVLNENDVMNAVSALILNVVFSVFGWEDGSWSFLETSKVPAEYTRFSFSTPNLVFWGLRQLEGQEDFNRFLPNPRVLVGRPNDLARLKDGLHLTYFEEQILDLIDGRRRLGEIVSLGRLAQVDVGRVLFSLILLGVLRVTNEQGGAARPVEGHIAGDGRPFDDKGTLLRTSVARLFSRIHLASLSGVVTIRRSGEETVIGFDAGEIVSARSSREEFRLGNVLLRASKITEAAFQWAAQVQRDEPQKRIGSIFLELRALSLEELDWALRFQAQAIVLDLFRWREGEYSFTEGESPEIVVTLARTAPDLIMEGARSTPPPPGIEGLLNSTDTVLLRVWSEDRASSVLQLSSAERRLLSYLDGGRTVSEVLSLNLLRPEELSRTLHGLLALEVVKALSGEAARKAEESRALFRPDWIGSGQPGGVSQQAPLQLEDEDTPFPDTRNEKRGPRRIVSSVPTAARDALADENRALRAKLEALEQELERLRTSSSSETREPAGTQSQALRGMISGIRDRLRSVESSERPSG